MGLSTTGIGSGLDVESIVTSLMNVERKPLNAVATEKTAYQSQISAYGTLKSALSTFQTAVSALSTVSKFNAQTVSSSNASVFTATSNGTASLGDYAITVNQLAKAQKLSSGGFTNTTDTVGTGTLTIGFGTYTAIGNTFTPSTAKSDVIITINSSNNTLAGVRDAINAANSSVSATIVNDGTTNRLVVTSKDTGEVNGLKISVADSDASNTDATGLSQLAFDPTASIGSGKNMTQLQAPKNALLDVDGIAVVKASNTVTDAISGVTLNLLTTSLNSANLGVSSNTDSVKTSVTAFVDAYNKLDTTLRSLTKYDETGKASGALLGDATARSVISQVKAVMTKTIASGNTINSLSQIGVSFQRDGKLALDSTKLTNAMTSNFSDIAAVFATSGKSTNPVVSYYGSTSKTQAGSYAVTFTMTGGSLQGTINGVAATVSGNNLTGAVGDASAGLNISYKGPTLSAGSSVTSTVNYSIGYATQFDSLITGLISDTSIVASRTEGINSSISRLDKQSASLTVRLAAIETRYRNQFTKLDTLMSSMTTTSSFLTQQIAAINANR
jgi:flagellar hook-associated protein 2